AATPYAPPVAPAPAAAAAPPIAAYAPAPMSPQVAEARPPDGKSSGFPVEPPSSSQPSSAAEKALRAPAPRIEPKTGDRHEVISHFPLEHDPDESVHFAVPGPPRVPSQPRA